jgi:hypothetical protein
MMWQKPTAQYPSILLNGQAWSLGQGKRAWQLTPASALVSWHRQEPMVKSQMQVLTYSDLRVLAQYPNGWIITFLFAFCESISLVTTACARLTLLSLHEMEACSWKGAKNGIMVQPCLMTGLKSLMKIFIPHPQPFSSIPMVTRRCLFHLLL